MDFSFSVIMPVFNRAAKVRRAIGSVQRAAQNAQESVEIVVIDDASSDDSAAAAHDAGAGVVLRLEANVGVTGARNRGIQIARGEYLVILDSDDELEADAFTRMKTHFERFPSTDILFGACMDRAGQPMHQTSAKFGPSPFERMLVHSIPGEFMPVVKRRVFQTVLFEEALRGFEGITWLKAARAGFTLYYSNVVLRIYDKEGDDRLCRRENMLRGVDRMARGWQHYLHEFGTDLWRLGKRAYLQVAVRSVLYRRLLPPGATKPAVYWQACGPLPARLCFWILRVLGRLGPRSLFQRYMEAR